jgi:hypothetical protein
VLDARLDSFLLMDSRFLHIEMEIEIKSRYRKYKEFCVYVRARARVSAMSKQVSLICIILIKTVGYRLTLPVAQRCTVQNTARVFCWQQFSAV